MRTVRRPRTSRGLTALAAMLLLGACSGSPTGVDQPTGTTAGSGCHRRNGGDGLPSGIAPGYPTDKDAFAPLIITTIAPDPIPVTGTDDQVHVTYELQVLNTSPRPATITKVETIAGGIDGKVVATIDQEEIVARTVLTASYCAEPVADRDPIGPGAGCCCSTTSTPVGTRCRPGSRTGSRPPTASSLPIRPEFATMFPTELTQFGGEVTTSGQQPVIIGPPLAGADWVAVNACCSLSPHRGAMVPLGGRINGARALRHRLGPGSTSPRSRWST